MKNENYSDHISRQFNQELDILRTHTLEMGGFVESQVRSAVESLVEFDTELAETVRDNDGKINNMESMIDEECARILARRQPAASDLRLILSVSRVVSDLERMGDEARKVAQHAMSLHHHKDLELGFARIRGLGNHVSKMVNDALDCFARLDIIQALDVVKEDQEVDREYAGAIHEMVSMIQENPDKANVLLDLIWVLRSLERIGDHSSNIAEHVVYLVNGQDVRHLGPDQLLAQIKVDEVKGKDKEE